jgi:hypothetical protein
LEGFARATGPYGQTSGPHSTCGTSTEGMVGMQKKHLFTLVVLCVALASIAMFLGGLPWDSIPR